ncbi:tuberoinfundibular peptide of 39 residues [Python bivittatus]|uniref:Tuberoinfundibular peptide of 39 residues n=1 Tax=Python bivittatus TaxID=176946 RepID=A0A9F5J0C5_PYTBI|nr:tuberoinfundibular peptide of 39 residues [Python bivittatus]
MNPVTGARKGCFSIIVILSSCALLASGIFLPRLQTPGSKFGKRDVSQYPELESNVDLKADLVPWGFHIPSITLQDWSLKWVSSDVTAPQDDDNSYEEQNRKSHLWGSTREEGPAARSQKGTADSAGWVPGWRGKRSIVVADDAAFREKSKMLTAMERQKWLNSYMQKFLW